MLNLLATLLFAMAASKEPSSMDSSLRTMIVPSTPESSTIILKSAIPEEGQVVSNPVGIQFRIDGFALGAPSPFERAGELVNSDMGQTIHVILDNRSYIPINKPAIDPLDESGFYYDMSYKFDLPYRLGSGMHTLRMFPARSYGESLKGENTFVALSFYVNAEESNRKMDLSQPYITYNEPSPLMPLLEGKPVLLDFYVTNTELSQDGYKVRLTVDGTFHRLLTAWQPFYIYGLKKGRHTVRLELLDAQDKRVPGEFNDVSDTITVH